MEIEINNKWHNTFQGDQMVEIKNKLYHIFQTESFRLKQVEVSRITGINQSSISRAIHNPDKVSIAWLVKCLKKLGYRCVFTVNKCSGKGQ
ncbi:MAG: helix-turn-helix transcriptional regulator [PVC group bacterium]|nr:helix-turn-helix transcriptional regulator [PVC group bacterium]